LPSYDYECEECHHVHESFAHLSRRDEPNECPKCKGVAKRVKISQPRSIKIKGEGANGDWRNENGGRGRYSDQLECYHRTRGELIADAESRGMKVHKPF